MTQMPQLNLIQKSVKLTSLLQSLNSFATCLSDLSWLFQQSLHIIQEFIRESFDYYKQRKSKRIRLDNIQKEYLTLKMRFESVDLKEIQKFINEIGKQQTQKRKSTHSSVGDILSARENPPSNTYRDQSRLRTDRLDLVDITERETLNRREQELNQKVCESNEQMRHLNYQITKLKQQNTLFREQIVEVRNINTILSDTIHNKRMNQLNAVDKIKSAIRIIKQQSGCNPTHLDRVLYSLVEFQVRLRQNANNAIMGEFYQPLQSVEVKRNNLLLQINTMMREVEDLKQDKNYVQDQIQQLGEIYEQKRIEGRTLATNNSIGCTCSVTQSSNDQMLLLQALTIEKLLG